MIGVASGAIYSPKNDLVNGKFYTSNGNNNYTVSLEIPYNATEQHDEVIVMVDGSTSVDTEWPAMREAIMKIGEAFLNLKHCLISIRVTYYMVVQQQTALVLLMALTDTFSNITILLQTHMLFISLMVV